MARTVRSILVTALIAACGSPKGGSPGDGGGTGSAVDAPTPVDAFAGPYRDFPTGPIVDMPAGGTPAPPNSSGLFGDPSTGTPTGGPCLIEPEIGTLYPHNWLRPRFSWSAVGGQNLFELRLTAANETDPLIVYTTATTWTMPADMWTALSAHIVDAPITVAIRGAVWNGSALTTPPALGSTGNIAIAPADAPGAIVYWTTSGGTGLRGFHIGDENVRDIVRPAQAAADTKCVGCHSSTPDGLYVGFSDSPQAGTGDPTRLALRTADGTSTEPPFLTASARTLMLRQNQEQPVFSKLHWSAGDHIAITMWPQNGFQIMWTDLEATSTDQNVGWGLLARTGDGNPAAYASFAHLTDNLLYVSSSNVTSGVSVGHGDLATVPYGNRQGGASTKISGADLAAYNEYYPNYSPDDRWVAYNRVADGQSSYNNHQAEVFVIPAAGGTATRLAANDPPTCSGKVSPGMTNSWPKWAPAVSEIGTKRYYWVTFSSTRSQAGNPQLYVTPVVEEGGAITTYPALYLWNQPAGENNHTPAWDNFDIPVN
jgi:mono/diheme cytochrome c family protein